MTLLNMDTPLSRSEFERLLKSGHGRATLHIQRFGLTDVADLVLEACLHHSSYEHPHESSRAEWLFTLFQDTPERSRFAAAIVEAVNALETDHEFQQCLELAVLLARNGDIAAFDAANRRLLAILAAHPEDWRAATTLISLRGQDALPDIARLYGRALLGTDTPKPPSLDDLDLDPGLDARNHLARFADNANIAAYLAYSDQQGLRPPAYPTRSRQQRRKMVKRVRPQKELLAELAAIRSADLREWESCLNHQERQLLESRLDEETEETVSLKLLYLFRHHPPKRIPSHWLTLAESGSLEQRRAACSALSHFGGPHLGQPNSGDPCIAELARRLLNQADFPGRYSDHRLKLFRYVLTQADAEQIEAKLKRFDLDELSRHEFGQDICDIGDVGPIPEMAGLLNWVYENSPCLNCRSTALARLIECGAKPPRLFDEGPLDAAEHIREIVSEAILHYGPNRGAGSA